MRATLVTQSSLSASDTCGRLKAGLSSLVAVCLAAVAMSGCGGTSPAPWAVSAPATQQVTLSHGGWSVRLAGARPSGGRLSMSLIADDRANAQALGDLTRDPSVAAGHPVHLGLSGRPLGPAGAVVERTLERPVPAGAVATLAYFDSPHAAWRAVPTTISPDRRTLTARVHHFSAWDDIEYGAGWLLDTRADPPKCDGGTPAWVDSVTFLDDKNAPLRWCVGRDPANAAVLVIKVVVNRSYGVAVHTAVQPQWTYDSLFGGGPDAFLSRLLANGATVPASLKGPFGGELPLMPGLEVDFGFTEAQARKASGSALVHVARDANAAIAGLTYSLLTKVAGNEGVVGRQVAAVTALLAVAQCEGDLGRPLRQHDWAGLAAGAIKCLTNNPEAVTNLLAVGLPAALPKADPKVLGKVAGKVGGKLWQVWAAGAFYKLATWAVDQKSIDAAYDLHVFPKITHHRPAVVIPSFGQPTTPTATQPATQPTAGPPGGGTPTCAQWQQMNNVDGDAALQAIASAHGDSSSLSVIRLSVGVFCRLYAGRTIDGIYSPGSQATTGGRSGPIPTCQEWEQMNNADADAALMQAAQLRHDPNPDIATLRLSAGLYCRLYPGRTIDGIYSG